MFSTDNFRAIILFLSILFIAIWTMEGPCTKQSSGLQSSWLQSAQAASDQATSDQAATQLPAIKAISQKALEKYQPMSVTIEEAGKEVKYSGVPLRVMFAEMVPEIKLDTMPEWKALSRKELIMEVKGDDGYPGLVPAIDLAINKAGDRFILATHRDGKPIESGVQLICKRDEAHTRWVRQVVSLRVLAVAQ
jgi:hypothetical protein